MHARSKRLVRRTKPCAVFPFGVPNAPSQYTMARPSGSRWVMSLPSGENGHVSIARERVATVA